MLSTSIEMSFLLFLCPVMLSAGVQTVTIDTHLGTSIEDCFERISIGEQIPIDAIYRNVSELTTRECETICRQDKQCQSYDYGVGAKGNATCNLSMADEKEIKEKRMLLRHPDYDVYVRRLNCEQSPPKPLQIQSDDPNGGPAHKPVFRPDDDDRRPPIDDLKPFESFRPEYKPIPPYRPNREPYRPDDYTNNKPINDMPPSYGDHKPAHIPYQPEKPSYKPDPYDQLHFRPPTHDRPKPPPNPALWRPDPYHPPQPDDDITDLYGPKPKPPLPIQPYLPTEKPIYHYFIRPPKKPQQTQIQRPDSYGQEQYPYNPIPEYGQEQSPNRPYPLQPYDKPNYSYNSQYAGSYSHNQEPIYVEIIDPPRPYRPPKRPYNRPNYSYGDFEQDNQGYGQSQANEYGVNQSNHGHRPNNDYNTKPQRPSYGGSDQNEPSYSQSPVNGYGTSDQGYPQRPHATRPGYQTPQGTPINNYVGSYNNRPSYSVTEKPAYGDHRPQSYIPYDNYYETENRPSNPYVPPYPEYNRPNDRPSYGGDNDYYESSGGYKNNQHRPIQSSLITVDKSDDGYRNRPTYDKLPAYGKEPSNGYGSQPGNTYGEKPYREQRPTYDKPSSSYGESTYGKPSSTYGEQRPVYEKPSSSYGEQKPAYETPTSSYGEQKPSYEKPNFYGEQRPVYQKPPSSYGEQTPAFEKPSSYGDQRPVYKKPPSSYGEQKPAYEKPNSYGESKPVYEKEPSPTYGNKPTSSYPSYGNEATPTYGNQATQTYTPEPPPTYENTPTYGQTDYKNSYTTPASNYTEPGYNRPDPGYRPDPALHRPDSSYNRPDPVYNRPHPGYLPEQKPVYEHRPEEPSYIYGPNGEVVTSRPVAVSSYGKRPDFQERKKMTYEG